MSKDALKVNEADWAGGADPALMKQCGEHAHMRDGQLPQTGEDLNGSRKRGDTSGGKQAMGGSGKANENTTNSY